MADAGVGEERGDGVHHAEPGAEDRHQHDPVAGDAAPLHHFERRPHRNGLGLQGASRFVRQQGGDFADQLTELPGGRLDSAEQRHLVLHQRVGDDGEVGREASGECTVGWGRGKGPGRDRHLSTVWRGDTSTPSNPPLHIMERGTGGEVKRGRVFCLDVEPGFFNFSNQHVEILRIRFITRDARPQRASALAAENDGTDPGLAIRVDALDDVVDRDAPRFDVGMGEANHRQRRVGHERPARIVSLARSRAPMAAWWSTSLPYPSMPSSASDMNTLSPVARRLHCGVVWKLSTVSPVGTGM